MSSNVQFTLEELKDHPEFAAFALAMEEKLRESEIRRRNAGYAMLGVVVPVLLSTGAGVYGLADRAISTEVERSSIEIRENIPELVSREVARTIDNDFQRSLVTDISEGALLEARTAYFLAASIAQVTFIAAQLDQTDAFSASEARQGISNLSAAINSGALNDPVTRDAVISAGAKMASSFAAANRADFLTEVALLIGTENALSSAEISLAVVTALGRDLVGSLQSSSSWPSTSVDLFQAAIEQSGGITGGVRGFQLAVEYRQFLDSPTDARDDFIENLLDDTALLLPKQERGLAAPNILLLSWPELFIRGGSDNMDANDLRMKRVMTSFHERYGAKLGAVLDDPEARDSAREFVRLVIQANDSGASNVELQEYVKRLCELSPKLCDSREDFTFGLVLTSIGVAPTDFPD